MRNYLEVIFWSVVTIVGCFLLFIFVAPGMFFGFEEVGIVVSKRVEPAHHQYSYHVSPNDASDDRIQGMPVEVKYFVRVSPLENRNVTVEWKVPKLMYDMADEGEEWVKP